MLKKFPYIIIIMLFFLSCDIQDKSNSNNDDPNPPDIPELEPEENLNYNPSVEELKTSGIPILTMTTSDGEMITSREEYKTTSFNILGDFCGEENLDLADAQAKGRGNSSWARFPKKPYSIKLSSKQKVLGMNKSKRWVLIANYSDKTLLRNYFAYGLGKDVYDTVWSPSFKSVHLILNGNYRGVYLLGENVKIDSKRVNIPDISETALNEGGFICEINRRADEDFNFITTKDVYVSLKDPDEVSNEIQERVRTVVQTAENVLFSDGYLDPLTGYKNYFNIDSVIDWYIINELTKNADAANNSSIFFYYRPADELIYMGPIWDFDISCGNIDHATCDTYTDLYIKNKSVWIKRMFTDAAFVTRLKERWNEKKLILWTQITTKIQEDANQLAAAANFNFNKWIMLGRYVWPNCAGYKERTTYQKEVDYMIQWLKSRYLYMDDAINSL